MSPIGVAQLKHADLPSRNMNKCGMKQKAKILTLKLAAMHCLKNNYLRYHLAILDTLKVSVEKCYWLPPLKITKYITLYQARQSKLINEQ